MKSVVTEMAVVMLVGVLFVLFNVSHGNAATVEPASVEQKNIIQAALGNSFLVSRAATVRSAHHGNAYYVGAVFHAEGVGDVLGIWLVGGQKNNPTLVFSVNGAAHQFSGMRMASATKAVAYSTDPEAKSLVAYFGM